MRARLGQERIRDVIRSESLQSGAFQDTERVSEALGVATTVCHLGLLFMRPLHVHIQLWLKAQVPSSAWKTDRGRGWSRRERGT